MNNNTQHAKILIIGSGPAGYTAAIYAARANMNPILIDGLLMGGQLTQTTTIENFPGFPDGINGLELMMNMRQQAERLGTVMIGAVVESVDSSIRPFSVNLDDGSTITADTLIVATGASPRHLGIPDEQKFAGAGVSYCATCDGFFYRQKDVAIVGGGDTAAEEALYLAGLANKVYMIVRRDVLRASAILQKRINESPNIEILWNSQVKNLNEENNNDNKLNNATIINKNNEKRIINIQGLFIAIGHTPNTDPFPQLETDDNGYIKVADRGQKTNIPGIFACGDVADPTYRQAITAAASGCRAAIDALKFLKNNL